MAAGVFLVAVGAGFVIGLGRVDVVRDLGVGEPPESDVGGGVPDNFGGGLQTPSDPQRDGSPAANGVINLVMGDLNDDNISILEEYAYGMLDTWLGWLDTATPIPEEQRAAQQQYDFTVRRLGYEREFQTSLGDDQSDTFFTTVAPVSNSVKTAVTLGVAISSPRYVTS